MYTWSTCLNSCGCSLISGYLTYLSTLFNVTPQSLALVDETISAVIKDGADYDDKLEMAKYSGETVSPPSWMRSLQPSKLVPRIPASTIATVTLKVLNEKRSHFLNVLKPFSVRDGYLCQQMYDRSRQLL